MERTGQVHVQHMLPLFRGDVGEQLLLGDARIAHQHIHTAQCLFCGAERKLAAGAGRHIALHGGDAGQLFFQLCSGFGIAVVQHRHAVARRIKGPRSPPEISTQRPLAAACTVGAGVFSGSSCTGSGISGCGAGWGFSSTITRVGSSTTGAAAFGFGGTGGSCAACSGCGSSPDRLNVSSNSSSYKSIVLLS